MEELIDRLVSKTIDDDIPVMQELERSEQRCRTHATGKHFSKNLSTAI